jgi:hypothetical protein
MPAKRRANGARMVLFSAALSVAGCDGSGVMEEPARRTSAAFTGTSAVFINELHYDNAGADAGEAFEVAGPAGTNLSGWSVALYNGNGGAVYDNVNLQGVIPNLEGGFGVLSFERAGIQNGSPDGIALVAPGGVLAQFLSYEGEFVGIGGPADGVSSTDIGVIEESNSPLGDSLQLVGTGAAFADFAFAPSTPNTFGAVNTGQTFVGGATDLPPLVVAVTPENGDFEVAPDATISVEFSEPVDVASGAFVLLCEGLPVDLAQGGGLTSFLLTPSVLFDQGDRCTLTVVASEVSDQDQDDPPDQLPADFVVSFQVRLPTTIAQVQGAAHRSPLETRSVSGVRGIVTAHAGNGFYFQEATPDGDVRTSDALFVFTGSAPGVVVGDEVEVAGPVLEFRSGCFPSCAVSSSAFANLTTTEITTPNRVVVLSQGNALPPPTVIGRGRGGRRPPSTVIDDDTSGSVEVFGETVFDPQNDGIDFYESLEAMRVQVNDALAVSPTNGFGEIAIVGDAGRGAGAFTPRGGLIVRPNDFNPERILIDDELVSAEPALDVGDSFAAPVIGVLSYSFGNFKLLNTEPLEAVAGGLEPETLCLGSKSDEELDVATFNVENLSPLAPASKFAALASIVVNNLAAPDLLSLEEVQDNSGPTSDGVVDATQTLTELVAAIVAAGGPTYEFREVAPVDGQDGGQPGGNIRVAFLFRVDRGLSFVDRPGATALTANDVTGSCATTALRFSPGRIDPENPAFENSRKPLAGEFSFRGQTLFVIANHFNSKGGDQPLFGRFQPPLLVTEARRVAQAGVIAGFVESLLAAARRAKVVVLGDLNDFDFAPPLEVLEAVKLRNAIKTLPRRERYTFIFDGNSQPLDHILLSPGAAQGGFEFDVVHVNAEFARGVSDHDPSVVRLRVP